MNLQMTTAKVRTTKITIGWNIKSVTIRWLYHYWSSFDTLYHLRFNHSGPLLRAIQTIL